MADGVSRLLIWMCMAAVVAGLGVDFAQAGGLSTTRLLDSASPSIAARIRAAPPVVHRIYRPHIDLAEIDERYFEAMAAESLRPVLVQSYQAYRAARFQQAVDVLKQADKDDRHVLLMQAIAYLALTGPETFKTSMEKLERAVAMKEPRAMLVLGLLNLVRTAYSPPNEKRGRELMEAAAASDDTVAIRALAEGYLAGWIGETDPSKSIALLKQAAAKGDAKASFRLAEHYFAGTGVRQDNVEAENYLIKSAEAGYVEAQAFLGTWRFLDLAAGSSDDAGAALEWLEKAAAANHPRALEYLGLFYAEIGKRIGQTDLPRAVGYFKRCVETSADQDCAFAYAQALENGIGVPQDLVAAIAMYSIANRDGLSIKALRQIDRIKDQLSKEQLMRAVSMRDTTLKGIETLTGVTTNRSKQSADDAARMRVTR